MMVRNANRSWAEEINQTGIGDKWCSIERPHMWAPTWTNWFNARVRLCSVSRSEAQGSVTSHHKSTFRSHMIHHAAFYEKCNFIEISANNFNHVNATLLLSHTTTVSFVMLWYDMVACFSSAEEVVVLYSVCQWDSTHHMYSVWTLMIHTLSRG